MMRVLFVDDEPNILSGIRRMMRSMRGEWEMEFAGSGPEAIEKLEAAPCDVIVSDMRMPGMDGAQLLSHVKEKLPGAIRIALSGETEQSMIYRCIENAHQYLAKPCDAGTLVETVRRACMLQGLLEDQELANRIKRLSSIPSLPENYEKIMAELQSEDASLQKIGEIVESDVAMTAKLLQLVNSAFFGLSQHVSSPSQATMLLGVDVIRTLVLSNGVFSQFDDKISDHIDLKTIWSRSTQISALARKIAMAKTDDKVLADYAFMAGMLIDIGEFVLAANMTEETAALWEDARQSGDPDWKTEQKVFGHSHAVVGAYLVGLWGLPNPIIEAVAYHHTPSTYDLPEFSALAAVHAALAIVSAGGDDQMPELDSGYIEQLGLEDQMPAWQQMYESQVQEKEA